MHRHWSSVIYFLLPLLFPFHRRLPSPISLALVLHSPPTSVTYTHFRRGLPFVFLPSTHFVKIIYFFMQGTSLSLYTLQTFLAMCLTTICILTFIVFNLSFLSNVFFPIRELKNIHALMHATHNDTYINILR